MGDESDEGASVDLEVEQVTKLNFLKKIYDQRNLATFSCKYLGVGSVICMYSSLGLDWVYKHLTVTDEPAHNVACMHDPSIQNLLLLLKQCGAPNITNSSRS